MISGRCSTRRLTACSSTPPAWESLKPLSRKSAKKKREEAEVAERAQAAQLEIDESVAAAFALHGDGGVVTRRRAELFQEQGPQTRSRHGADSVK